MQQVIDLTYTALGPQQLAGALGKSFMPRMRGPKLCC